MLELLKHTFSDFSEDECPLRAAGLAYYTIFSLPPLLVLILMLMGFIWDPQTIQRALEGQFAAMLGPEAAAQIHTMIQNADRPGSGGLLATLVGLAGLVFGATGAFLHLQGALNRAWEVEPDPEKGGILMTILKRLFSFVMILGIAFLLLVSLLLSTALSVFGSTLTGMLPGSISQILLQAIELTVSFGVITLLFALMFKVVPDAEIAWRDVWAGAAVTALLFAAGKFGIGFYLGRSNPAQAFGAAGALAVLLLWIYYSGLIVLLGAEFTQAWMESRGGEIRPAKGAVRVVEDKRYVRGGERRGRET